MNSQSSSTPSIKNIDSINAVQMIEHGLNALRQIPGSFFVLGIFVVSSQPITEQVEDMVKLKGILKQLVGWVGTWILNGDHKPYAKYIPQGLP